MKTYAVDEEGKYSVVARNKKALLVPKKVAADKYPVQSIDKFCYRKNYENWDVEFLLIPKEENAISFPYSCLLYTSPSPRDATLSRMPSSA